MAGDSGRFRKLNRSERAPKAARLVRELLPGDARYGDLLSTAGQRPADAAGRQIRAARGPTGGRL